MMANGMRLVVLLIATLALAPAEIHAGEALPPRALARIGEHRFYHGPGLTHAVLSADGRRIASVANSNFFHDNSRFSDEEREAYDSTIVLWDAATGERIRELRVPRDPLYRLAFSPDGKLLAATGDRCTKPSVILFEVESGKLLHRFKASRASGNGVASLQFSADGKQLHVSQDEGAIHAWDVGGGKQLRRWDPPPLPLRKDEDLEVVKGVLAPDGKIVVWEIRHFDAAGEEKHILHFHDAETGKALYQKSLNTSAVALQSFVFSRDGKRSATPGHKKDELTVWETATGKEVASLKIPELEECLLTPDGRHAVVEQMYPPRLSLYDLQTRERTRDFAAGRASFYCAPSRAAQMFSADGRTLLLTTDSTLRLFDMRTGRERGVPGHRTSVVPRFAADGRTLLTVCEEKRCRWDVSKKVPVLVADEPRQAWDYEHLAHSPDERFVLDLENGRARIRDSVNGRIVRDGKDHVWKAVSGRFSPDGLHVLLGEIPGNDLSSPAVVFRQYDIKTGKASGEIEPEKRASDLVFSPDGRLLAWEDAAGAIHLHDAASGKAVRTLRSTRPLKKSEFRDARLVFSPDSLCVLDARATETNLVTGRTPLPLRVFHVASGRELGRFPVNPEPKSQARALSCLAWSPDGRLLAVAEEGSGLVRLLELAGGKVRAEFTGHRHGVHGLSFAPDGKTLASGGEDNVVFLWDVTGARTTTTKPPHDRDLPSLWKELVSDDGGRAGAAIASLLRKPDAAVAFLQEHLRPAETPDAKRLAQWIAALDADTFDKREAAACELLCLGQRAEAALRRELKNRPSLEMRRRIEELLSKLESGLPPPEILRTLRAIEVLEHAGTPAARRCLETLAKGAEEARTTREAKAALRRLAKRRE